MREIGESEGPFDIVVDDGSHQPKHIITTFEALYPFLKDEGHYFVEDVQTSYVPSYGGSFDLGAGGTTMNYFRALVDNVNHVYLKRQRIVADVQYPLQEICFYRHLIAMKK